MSELPTRRRAGEAKPTLLPPSLRIKLLLFAAALVTIPGVVYGVLAQQSGRESLQRVIGGELAREAGHTARRLSDALQSERQTLRSLARQDVMREIRVDDIDKRISAALATLREGSPVRSDYLVSDARGRVIASSNPELIGAAGPWSEAARGALRGEEGFEGPGEERSPTEKDTLTLATPVRDPDGGGDVIGALVGIYDWRELTGVMREVRDELAALRLSTDVLLVRPDGAVIAEARSARADEHPASAPWAEIAAMTGAQPDYVVRSAAGLLIGRAALEPALGGWRLLIAEPLDDALAPVRRLTARLATTLALLLAAALGVAALSAERVARPLRELTAAIRALSHGEVSSLRAPVRSQDEVGALAAAFNQMSSALEQAQSDLVEAAKFAFIGELAGGVAHEVRTSLGVLRSSAQMLERSLSTDGDRHAAELAELIRAEVDRLGGVVNDLLGLARPRAPRFEAMPIAQPVFRAVDLVEPQAADRNIRIRRTRDPSDPVVLGDAELLVQVALNLLVNAVQAQGSGGEIEVRSFVGAGGRAGFEVRDRGPGVPDELRERIFHPFVTGREGGIGLGLTFVKRVVHEHRGRISVESRAGGGACFRVEFPPAEAAP